tara:strand:+ start:983 stop:1411 length:429 start_codon:yes stop_codon:yes gene_type:complete
MSQIISFSADNDFANDLDSLIRNSGYQNRSRFLRDAAIFFAEDKQRGEFMSIDDDVVIEGHLVVHYEHTVDQKLMVARTGSIEIAAYHHSSRLGHSCHLCVDVVHVKGSAADVRDVYRKLQNTQNVNKVSFIIAPMSQQDCC